MRRMRTRRSTIVFTHDHGILCGCIAHEHGVLAWFFLRMVFRGKFEASHELRIEISNWD
jgi:hypothetical protein